MYRSPLKPILLGLVLGIVLLAIPFFLLKVALFFLLIGALFRFVGRRIYWSRPVRSGYAPHGYGPGYAYGLAGHPALADTIRNMSDEEYGTFRQKLADEQSYASNTHKTTIEIQ